MLAIILLDIWYKWIFILNKYNIRGLLWKKSSLKQKREVSIQVRCGNPFFKRVLELKSVWLPFFFDIPRDLNLVLFHLDSSTIDDSSGDDDYLMTTTHSISQSKYKERRTNNQILSPFTWVSLGNLFSDRIPVCSKWNYAFHPTASLSHSMRTISSDESSKSDFMVKKKTARAALN